MALNVSALSIRHPLPPIVLAAAMIVLGLISFSKLPVTRMPNVDAPVVSVLVTQFGAAPAELESQVTKRIEEELRSQYIVAFRTDSQKPDGQYRAVQVAVDKAGVTARTIKGYIP